MAQTRGRGGHLVGHPAVALDHSIGLYIIFVASIVVVDRCRKQVRKSDIIRNINIIKGCRLFRLKTMTQAENRNVQAVP